jgi:carboxypeptidase D
MCSRKKIYSGPKGQGPEGEGDLSADPIDAVLPQIIEATNRVVISNGENDFIIQSNGTLLSIQNMTWNGKLGFQQAPSKTITIPKEGVRGIQHFERGLLWADSHNTGHMGPGMAPSVAWQHLRWMLGQIEAL